MGGRTVASGVVRVNAAQPSVAQPSAALPPAALPCPSWVLATGTAVHVAKDRSWFCVDYRPISSALTSDAPVIGMGTMHLPVKQTPGARNRGHGTLTLRDVLHVPSALCNIVGTPVFQDYNVSLGSGPGSDGSISLFDGTPVAYITPGRRLPEVRLSGPPIGPRVGPSPFKPDAIYWIKAAWSETEREKWLDVDAALASGDAPQTPAHPSDEEERWLKRHVDGGFEVICDVSCSATTTTRTAK
ncbi:hypothetical protein LMH87_004577 [Akanthomyces muscarius]|uniref:Retrovirus-related Pol polyprotein from transposon TNT 1-94-like beta-barrel domain-containing protein n=1 Tax=Akanthomyces muscarius TaxID=2231603 RepID=A0A9W8UI09_AKAMU|nr:hypothetical protein LMH87_004577 [Akanthomyces muscarius]KAJ4145740.1 hypothetical protein LMH87_004577 [Akanthomyces muscarius]